MVGFVCAMIGVISWVLKKRACIMRDLGVQFQSYSESQNRLPTVNGGVHLSFRAGFAQDSFRQMREKVDPPIDLFPFVG